MFLIDPYRFAAAAAYDTDAQAYITAVETADGQALETAVKDVINAFVVGCKSDGIWNAIKASCILAGARTLAGALVPLVGAAPTNFNFVSGDYDRKTGLVGNGSSKYLDANRLGNIDPQNSRHLALFCTTAQTNLGIYAGADISGRSTIYGSSGDVVDVAISQALPTTTGVKRSTAVGLIAASRTSSTNTNWIVGNTTGSFFTVSTTPPTGPTYVFARSLSGPVPGNYSNAGLAFYSIGESLDLALLNSRVSTLFSDLAAAIP